MGSDERKKNDQPTYWMRALGLRNNAGTTALLIGMILLGLAVGSFALWRRYGPEILQQPEFVLTSNSIEITPPPPWILSDVRSEAILTANLGEMDIRQPDVALQIANAFEMHPWIAKVKRASKRYPAKVIVELIYRRPVAMVEMPEGLYPIDSEGVLLPTADFGSVCQQCGKHYSMDATHRDCPVCQIPLTSVARNYPRLAVDNAMPMGQLGDVWADPRIVAGGRLATIIGPIWQRLDLHRIVAKEANTTRYAERKPYFELVSRSNARVIWGHAPGDEDNGEAPAETKLARLVQYLREEGSLDALGSGQALDLRKVENLEVANREDFEILQ